MNIGCAISFLSFLKCNHVFYQLVHFSNDSLSLFCCHRLPCCAPVLPIYTFALNIFYSCYALPITQFLRILKSYFQLMSDPQDLDNWKSPPKYLIGTSHLKHPNWTCHLPLSLFLFILHLLGDHLCAHWPQGTAFPQLPRHINHSIPTSHLPNIFQVSPFSPKGPYLFLSLA